MRKEEEAATLALRLAGFETLLAVVIWTQAMQDVILCDAIEGPQVGENLRGVLNYLDFLVNGQDFLSCTISFVV